MRTAREAAARLGPIGVWSFDLERMTAADEGRFAQEVEALGFGALWIPESLGSKELFAHAAILLAATKTLVVASGIANIWARDPVAMANGARTLQEAYADRFLCGVGVSHKPTIDARLGGGYSKPLSRMRAYLEAMDRAPYVGPNRNDPPAPRVLAALGPQMLRLSAERSLGAHPYFVPVEHTTIARAELGPDPLLAVEQACTLEVDATKAREIARRHMKRYLELDNYANNLRRLSWGDADIGNGGSDALVDAIVAWGGVDAVTARANEHRTRGADHVCLQVFGDDVAGQLRTIAAALR
ncbi:MAG TPA: TIGR03620 family F420-dependent LLM class oxidoreductase [Candidatus Limnocylindria bacterium]|nr:TIGR03620 family F420-dependent LLM class oxidoreductase [Candidatus Limnocylindria bacterium]